MSLIKSWNLAGLPSSKFKTRCRRPNLKPKSFTRPFKFAKRTASRAGTGAAGEQAADHDVSNRVKLTSCSSWFQCQDCFCSWPCPLAGPTATFWRWVLKSASYNNGQWMIKVIQVSLDYNIWIQHRCRYQTQNLRSPRLTSKVWRNYLLLFVLTFFNQ